MIKKTVNKDLQKERKTFTFNLEELTNLLDDGAEKTEKRRKLGNNDYLCTMKYSYSYPYILIYYYQVI